MGNRIDIRVNFHGNERLLRLMNAEGGWHAALLIPGRLDIFSQECPAPSPPGTKLPVLEVGMQELWIEAAQDKMVSMEMGRLLASPEASVKDGWLGAKVKSLMWEYPDYTHPMRGEKPQKQFSEILNFPASVSRQPGKDHDRGR